MKKLLKYTFLVLISFCSLYFIVLVMSLRDAKCADAQCYVMPFFVKDPPIFVDAVDDATSGVQYSQYPAERSACGIIQYDAYTIAMGGPAYCAVEATGVYGQPWRLVAFKGNTTVHCGFQCFHW